MLRFVFCALVLAWTHVGSPAHADEILSDGIAAQVGGDIVLVSEVLTRVAPVESKMRSSGAPEIEIAKLRASGLEMLIESRLIDQVVQRAELYATEEEIDQTIDMIARDNGITRDQLDASVKAQGLSEDEYRGELKKELERRKVIGAMVASKVNVEESEVRVLYDQRFGEQPEGGETVHLRQILVPIGGEGDAAVTLEAACKEVKAGRKRIVAGEAFEKVAYEISRVAPAQGGDIGWLHSDTLANWMAGVVGPLKDGEMSDVVELPFGCSLLKLVERRIYEPVAYEDAKEQLHMELYEQHLDTAFRKWIEDMREQTFIERKGHFADAAMLGSKSGYAEKSEEESPF